MEEIQRQSGAEDLLSRISLTRTRKRLCMMNTVRILVAVPAAREEACRHSDRHHPNFCTRRIF
jgi:hypothetical protein